MTKGTIVAAMLIMLMAAISLCQLPPTLRPPGSGDLIGWFGQAEQLANSRGPYVKACLRYTTTESSVPRTLFSLYLSSDDALTTDDLLLKNVWLKRVDHFGQDRCAHISARVHETSVTSGVRLLGVLDALDQCAESREDNNIVLGKPLR